MGIRFIGTLANRLFTSLLNFLIVVITARYLGVAGRGEISLIVLGVSIIQMISGIMGGGAIVYLAPRYQQIKILIISSCWALLVCLICPWLLVQLHLVHSDFILPLFVLGFMVSLFANIQSLLLARQNFKGFNISSVLQPFTLLITFYLWVGQKKVPDINDYIHASYAGYGISLLTALLFLKPASPVSYSSWKELIRKFLHHGGWGQLANLAQLLNYRFSYYLIESVKGVHALGIFSTGISVSESVWVFSKSLSTVKYANSSNESNFTKLHGQALLLIKFSITGTLILTGVLCIIPDYFYLQLFGKSFYGIQWLMVNLAPGILFLSVYTILAAYFSGTGRHHLSSKASLIGLLVTIPACYAFIPVYGITGAAWAGNLSHLANGAFLLFYFKKEEPTSWRTFFPSGHDFTLLKKIMKGI